MKACFFDAYGTLFDVHSAVTAHADAVGPEAGSLSATWRAKQLEYSWIHALMDDYVDFWRLTQRALDFAFAAHPEANRDMRDRLLEAYFTLKAYPEVRDVLDRLRGRGTIVGILSNGSPDMLEAAVKRNDLRFDHTISVDPLRTFKTRAETYQTMVEATGLAPDVIRFHSSNRWDVAGATRFGCRTVWVNRTGQPDEYEDHAPERVVSDLTEIVV